MKSCLSVLLTSLFLAVNVLADGHAGECISKSGVEKLRCERHLKMAVKCGPLKGDAHFACDREFLLANPLVCTGLKDDAGIACKAEFNAFKTCESNAGREFMKCVAQTTGQNPVGH